MPAGVDDLNFEPARLAGQRDADGFVRALLGMRFNRPGARLTHRQAYLVHERLGDAAAPGHGRRDQPGRPHVSGQRGEGDLNCCHLVPPGAAAGWLLLRLPMSDGLVYRVVDAENLGQTGDAEDFQYPLLSADQVKRSIVGPDSLQPADQDAQASGVKELHLFHVDDELVIAVVDQVNKEFAETRRGVDVDLAFYVDDLDAVLVVVIQLQIHRFLLRHTSIIPAVSRADLLRRARCDAPGAVNHARLMFYTRSQVEVPGLPMTNFITGCLIKTR